MHHVATVYGQRWLGITVLILGVAVFAFGLWADVANGGDLQRLGTLVFIAGIARVKFQADASSRRAANRLSRLKRTEPVLVRLPRREDANR